PTTMQTYDAAGRLVTPGTMGGSETPQTFNDFPEDVKIAAKARLAGMTVPTGNPRKGFVQEVGMAAQKLGDELGIPSDDSSFYQRRQYRNQLAMGSPSSVGGQRTMFNTAGGHLSDVAEAAKDLGHWSGLGNPYLARGVNLIRSGW